MKKKDKTTSQNSCFTNKFNSARDALLMWYFMAENHDLYVRWKEEFLADPPADFVLQVGR